MKRLLIALALLLAVTPVQAQRDIKSWVDLGVYVGEQTTQMNANTEAVKALQAEVALLRKDIGTLGWHHDVAVRYWLVQSCATNTLIPSWSSLVGIKPIPIGSHECPQLPTRFYVPGYVGSTVPIPPENGTQ